VDFLHNIPTPILIACSVCLIIILITYFMWLPLKARITIDILTLAVLFGSTVAFIVQQYQFELLLIAGFMFVVLVPSLVIYYRRLISNARQVREYRARAIEARQRGDNHTAALHDQTAESIRKSLGRIKV
jgi:hypothetical protein